MTEDFADAAYAEAETSSHHYSTGSNYDDDLDRTVYADGFRDGTAWAWEYLAAQEPSDAEVEAAARSIALDESDSAEPDLASYRLVARHALSAARNAQRVS